MHDVQDLTKRILPNSFALVSHQLMGSDVEPDGSPAVVAEYPVYLSHNAFGQSKVGREVCSKLGKCLAVPPAPPRVYLQRSLRNRN